MDYSELPADLKTIGTSAKPAVIAAALQEALGNGRTFYYYKPVRGGPSSVRLFSVNPAHESIEMIVTPASIVRELELLNETGAARYDPEQQPDPNVHRGWEVSSFILDGAPAAIVRAMWTSN